jgi:hypothetical protein
VGSPWDYKLVGEPVVTESDTVYEAFLCNTINFELEHAIQHFIILLLSSSIPEFYNAFLAENVCVGQHKFNKFKFEWISQSMWVLGNETLAIRDP